jgi:hypothetical protein
MSKYKDTNYVQVNREILHDFCDLRWRAKWLYIILSELEHRFTGAKADFFFRSQKDLSKDSGMKPHTNRKYRKELIDKGWEGFNHENNRPQVNK